MSISLASQTRFSGDTKPTTETQRIPLTLEVPTAQAARVREELQKPLNRDAFVKLAQSLQEDSQIQGLSDTDVFLDMMPVDNFLTKTFGRIDPYWGKGAGPKSDSRKTHEVVERLIGETNQRKANEDLFSNPFDLFSNPPSEDIFPDNMKALLKAVNTPDAIVSDTFVDGGSASQIVKINGQQYAYTVESTVPGVKSESLKRLDDAEELKLTHVLGDFGTNLMYRFNGGQSDANESETLLQQQATKLITSNADQVAQAKGLFEAIAKKSAKPATTP